jgi:hypothetical protein
VAVVDARVLKEVAVLVGDVVEKDQPFYFTVRAVQFYAGAYLGP